MFNKKEINELKEEMSKKFDSVTEDIAKQSKERAESFEILQQMLAEIKKQNIQSTEHFKKEMGEILKLKTEFETSLHRINSVNRTIEDRAAESVKEVAEREISTINASAKKFRELEGEMRAVMDKVNLLNQELSKFVLISQQIKLVDFSLQKHQHEIRQSERERTQLLEENERLKEIMAKMKRNRN